RRALLVALFGTDAMLTPDAMQWTIDRLGTDVLAFLPELLVCVGIVWLMFWRLFTSLRSSHLGSTAPVLALVALALSYLQWAAVASPEADTPWYRALLPPPEVYDVTMRELRMFGGLLAYDSLTIFLRMFLYAAAALLIGLSLLTGIPDREDSADFNVLLL